MTDSLMITMLPDLDRLVDRDIERRHNMGEPVITCPGYWPLISDHVTTIWI